VEKFHHLMRSEKLAPRGAAAFVAAIGPLIRQHSYESRAHEFVGRFLDAEAENSAVLLARGERRGNGDVDLAGRASSGLRAWGKKRRPVS